MGLLLGISRMLSLPKPITKLLKDRSLPSEGQECFRAAVASAAEKLVITPPSENDEIRDRLLALVSSLDEDTRGTNLKAAAEEFDRILADHQVTERHILQRREDTVRQTFSVLDRVLHDVRDVHAKQSNELAALVSSLASTATVGDLKTNRLELELQTKRLHATVDALEQTRLRMESDLSSHLNWLRERHGNEGITLEDSLTGLVNRRAAETELQRQQAGYAVFSILFIDIRSLKAVNHTSGRSVGDQVLKLIANRLKSLSKPSETVCRWGGEEFLVVLRSSLPLARMRSEELREPLNMPFTVEGREGRTVVSAETHIGVAEYSAGDCIDDLVARAHADMHQQNLACGAWRAAASRN